MNNGNWWLGLIKVAGVPGAVAAYFMLRDWTFMAESIRLQTTMVELLRQLASR